MIAEYHQFSCFEVQVKKYFVTILAKNVYRIKAENKSFVNFLLYLILNKFQ